jgi:hypothetical protein
MPPGVWWCSETRELPRALLNQIESVQERRETKLMIMLIYTETETTRVEELEVFPFSIFIFPALKNFHKINPFLNKVECPKCIKKQ